MKPNANEASSATPSLQLRSSIGALHTSIEELPIAKAMVQGTVERSAYAQLLQALRDLHALVEEDVLPALPDAIMTSAMVRTPAIDQDLACLGAEPKAVAELGPLIAAFRSRVAAGTPQALIGVIYVLEGSRMGSMVLHRPLAKALGVPAAPGNGLDYHMDGMAETPKRVMGMKAAVDQALSSPEDAASAAAMANATMTLLHEIYRAVSVCAGLLPGADQSEGAAQRCPVHHSSSAAEAA